MPWRPHPQRRSGGDPRRADMDLRGVINCRHRRRHRRDCGWAHADDRSRQRDRQATDAEQCRTRQPACHRQWRREFSMATSPSAATTVLRRTSPSSWIRRIPALTGCCSTARRLTIPVQVSVSRPSPGPEDDRQRRQHASAGGDGLTLAVGGLGATADPAARLRSITPSRPAHLGRLFGDRSHHRGPRASSS